MGISDHDFENMIPVSAGTATPRHLIIGEDGVLLSYGTSVPSTANVYAPGCMFIDVSDGKLYVNGGTYASPSFAEAT